MVTKLVSDIWDGLTGGGHSKISHDERERLEAYAQQRHAHLQGIQNTAGGGAVQGHHVWLPTIAAGAGVYTVNTAGSGGASGLAVFGASSTPTAAMSELWTALMNAIDERDYESIDHFSEIIDSHEIFGPKRSRFNNNGDSAIEYLSELEKAQDYIEAAEHERTAV